MVTRVKPYNYHGEPASRTSRIYFSLGVVPPRRRPCTLVGSRAAKFRSGRAAAMLGSLREVHGAL